MQHCSGKRKLIMGGQLKDIPDAVTVCICGSFPYCCDVDLCMMFSSPFLSAVQVGEGVASGSRTAFGNDLDRLASACL